MAVAAFWFSLMSVCVKLAGERLPSMEIVFFRGVVSLVLSLAIIRQAGVTRPWGTRKPMLIVRGTLGAAALCCFVFSLTHLPLGEATLIQYTNPVFAIVIAAYWYHERLRKPEIVALAFALVGLLMVTRPAALFGGADGHIPVGYAVIALFGAAFSGSAYAVIRSLRGEHPDVVVLYLPLMQIPMSLPFIASGWFWPTWREWMLLLGVGVTTQLAQASMTRGLQQERIAPATTVGYLQVIFAGVWGVMLFGEHPGVWTVVGALVILASTVALLVLHRAAENEERAAAA